MERIIVYKNDSFDWTKSHYNSFRDRLQAVAVLVLSAGSTPTMERLQRLTDQREKWTVSQINETIPQENSQISGSARLKALDRISVLLREIKDEESKVWAAVPVKTAYFSVNSTTGVVSLDPSFEEAITQRFAECIDSEAKSGIYAKIQKVIESVGKVKADLEDLNRAVKAAPKRELSDVERKAVEKGVIYPPECIMGFDPTKLHPSMISINGDQITVNGKLFGYFK